MLYRKATLSDIDELVSNRIEMRIEREAKENLADFSDFHRSTYDYFLKRLSDESFIAWIAVDGNRVIATSGLCFYYAPPTYKNRSGITAYIMNMYTKPGYRNQGIASKLLGYLIEEAKSKGCTKVTLNASDMGRRIYEMYGFKDLQNEMVYYIE